MQKPISPVGVHVKGIRSVLSGPPSAIVGKDLAFADYLETEEDDEDLVPTILNPQSSDWSEPDWNDTRPIQLLRSTPLIAQFEITEEGRELFTNQLANNRLVLVTVCGLYRTGKSYLMNLLSGQIGPSHPNPPYTNLFETSGTINACTNGIWVWPSSPTNPTAPVYLLVDCEGSGNVHNNKDHDMKLFAVALLISSVFIYNSKGIIDESSISILSLILNLSNIISKNEKQLAPSLLWILRDFHLDIKDSTGAVISPSEYFTNCLDGKRKSEFCEFFSNLDCATLVTPLVDETKLPGLVGVPWSALRGEFRDAIQSTRRKIFRNLKIKKEFNGIFFINICGRGSRQPRTLRIKYCIS
jgi:hypothetical protein